MDHKKVYEDLKLAYLFAVPLAMTEAVAYSNGNVRNEFVHKPGPADADRRIVARPGVDQVASYAWLDLTSTPFILETPSSFMDPENYPHGRYVSYQIMDAWTNVVAMLGTGFVNGSNGGTYVFTGPDYQGEVPADMYHVSCPTNVAIVWSRTFCMDLSEMPVISEFKTQFKIRPLYPEKYTATPRPAFPGPVTHPVAMVQALDIETFFNYFNELSTIYYPFDYDKPILERLKPYGIGPGLTFKLDQFEAPVQEWLKTELAAESLRESGAMWMEDSDQVNYWLYSADDLGYYKDNYRLRGSVAMTGYAANPVEVCQYFTSEQDAEGNQLQGGKKYCIHFEADKLPPIADDGYWSLVAYDGVGYYLIRNPLGRYRLSGMSKELKYNADGSLDLLIQDSPPADEWLGNYLPVCTDGPFCLCLRLYSPLAAVEARAWIPPVIIAES
ncbi:MAG: DUF1214 domain-containing protein [Oscillospiraceae bacterium]|nr:DUF1214 domain-containing protein [Oscillospiraceae bacterium]